MTYLTESVQLPGLELEGRAKKLPSTPLFRRICSASTPWIFGWNHLKFKRKKIKKVNLWLFIIKLFRIISLEIQIRILLIFFRYNMNEKYFHFLKHNYLDYIILFLPTYFFIFAQLTTRIIFYGSHYQIVVTHACFLMCNRSFIYVRILGV